jgi:AcrR family transcriptional regulator
LADVGYHGFSVLAVADRAGTTRPAIYRRYDGKTTLAIAAIAALAERTAPAVTGDHLEDLIAELRSFRSGITELRGLALVSTVLDETTDPAVRAAYREAVVAPRRRRVRAILDAAHADGVITADAADRRVAVTLCTGSWYAFALAGERPPKDWPTRTARLVWIAVGG